MTASDVHPIAPGTEAGRPRLHLTAPRGWINDPLGLTFHDGQYHLFYQHVPEGTDWAPACHWGHATSPDLFHWTHQEAALSPGEGDDGCWSGNIAVREDGETFLFYTTVDSADVTIGKARIARPHDPSWSSWKKGDVVAQLPEDVAAVAYRDPFVFADAGRWWMLMGAGLEDGTATACVYVSDDLESWSYDGLLTTRSTHEADPLWMGSVWECPQLIPLAGKHVLLVSVWEPWVPHYEAYAIGTYANGEFTPETWRRLSYGPSYYAGAAYTDREGRAGIIYWLRGIADPASTWAGANSLPHVLELRDHQVVAQPHPDLDGLRVGAPQVLSGRPLPSDSPQYATCMTPSDLEWQIRVDEGFNQLRLTASDGVVLLDLTVAGGTARACTAGGTWEMPTAGPLRLIVDAPICELFGTRGVLAVPIDHTDGFVKVELVGESQLLVHQLHASPVKVQPLGSPPPAGGRG